ncbi:MAG: Lrp/AsnC ligand binding domain-containing protein [Muribaculaceae bacterium]|nr:AsnC family transcriptional regulator [Bacteroides sp.]MDE7473819.1 Lrp/AsnC ligand binding domain-containing protein [Muribaculaceae bacterium]
MARQQLDALDVKILGYLLENARRPFLEIARECKVSGAAVHQRIARLQSLGVIKGSELLINPSSLGFDTCSYVGFFLKDPTRLNEVIEKLKDIPEVVECHFTTGRYDLFIKLYARNNDDLLNIIQNKLLCLGLARTESLISFKEIFNRPLPVGPGEVK